MDQADFFKCLSDPTRLDILKIILERQNVCVCEITEILQLSQPKISRHLALLRNLSILLDERKGQWVYYRLNPDLPEWVNAVLNVLSNEVVNTAASNLSISMQCE
ncbi:metalloregulator ArsR/SmtB family transcription factor [Acinetobacter bohemicus]|uniref:Metalloregulator ArsR/SmtB family transcription factor n=1 Tax=Acinetobacter lwoffii TaxID=28090 RepID=A0A9D2USU3_ACILW|nr:MULTISPECIES: metalloregulator ArsR/SmtB family transcription factor [Acinetobacter]MDM1780504.1 metalloregulator ArsR/SmtB family transcription factor [Acinetobacter indicus]HJF28049.1 metalloregulator ArsR/SmtB family transcription factor [Acinetobacter lwoffii]MCO8041660.1 metalloregulator ArsR/SmtB family transcription factor [Acinetobacter sp. S4400-12]MCO8046501.1 metalloregulator ArsR/SmtB family transcription factor [Acinetobacter sp. S4397-1]MCU7223677.1 metalloregulator ArsR/SmtB 